MPIVSLTADAQAQAMEDCLEAGMQAFLTKPLRTGLFFCPLLTLHLSLTECQTTCSISYETSFSQTALPDFEHKFLDHRWVVFAIRLISLSTGYLRWRLCLLSMHQIAFTLTDIETWLLLHLDESDRANAWSR
jgi:CheY-like chemotaxis protein